MLNHSPDWLWKPTHAGLRAAARRFKGSFGRAGDRACEAPLEGSLVVGGLRIAWLGWPGGEATPLVLLHGLDGNPWCWARTAGLLAGPRRVFAPALRGHGRSDTPDGDYSFESLTRDLVGFLDELGLERVVLGGHSWGGKVAVHFAASHPARVESLVLADPAAPGPHHPVFRHAPFLMETALRPERQVYPDRRAWREGAKALVFLRWGDSIDERLWAEMFREDGEGRMVPRLPESAFREILYGQLDRDLRPHLPHLTMPVLLLRPNFTVSPFPSQVRPFRRLVPHLRERRVEGDHNFPNSNPVDAARLIEDFLAQ